jgi:NADH-quinone oxidoreductase subunit J
MQNITVISILHFFFLMCSLCTGLYMQFSKNAIYSALALILTFFFSAINLFFFGLDFLGILFIMIYVGAVAVLFLFVLMMLSIRTSSLETSSKNLYIISLLLSFIAYLYTEILTKIFAPFSLSSTNFLNFDLLYDNFSTLVVLGQVLYNNFLVCFLICGFILLVAMLGAILLTLTFKKTKQFQSSPRQLSRSSSTLRMFK